MVSVLFLLLLFSYFFFFSGFFKIKNIVIENNVNLKKGDLIRSTEESISIKLIGVIPSDNFFIADENSIRSFLVDRYPMLEKVEIKKSSYNSLTIDVKEKGSRIIWCRPENCFYLDGNSVALANAKEELKLKDKPIKIFEQKEIEEEIGDEQPDKAANAPEKATISTTDPSAENKPDEAKREPETAVETPINIGDRVADAKFVQFLDDLDRLIAKKTSLQIKYYKTKGVETREIIAYTDKNTRLYFDSSASPDLQTDYLTSFLNESVDKDKISALKYIYLKSDNKIFYK
jgi:hypothetical protein